MRQAPVATMALLVSRLVVPAAEPAATIPVPTAAAGGLAPGRRGPVLPGRNRVHRKALTQSPGAAGAAMIMLAATLVALLANGQPTAGAGTTPAAAPRASGYEMRKVSGWSVHVSRLLLSTNTAATDRALELLAAQLDEIVRRVPSPALTELRKVTLWVSPEYPGVKPRAEYHPDAGWLRAHGRDPAMAKAVEFTNVRIFESETRRMPNFALHELAHAYHDRVLPGGFENASIKAAHEKAKLSGKYDHVEQRFGDGRRAYGRAYAMTDPQEYFAESTEAFFATNDFFPFTREELQCHDPEMFALLEKLWGVRKTSAQGSQFPGPNGSGFASPPTGVANRAASR